MRGTVAFPGMKEGHEAEATKKLMRSRYGRQVNREFRDGVLNISLFLVLILGVLQLSFWINEHNPRATTITTLQTFANPFWFVFTLNSIVIVDSN